jgi:hypothetical protein
MSEEVNAAITSSIAGLEGGDVPDAPSTVAEAAGTEASAADTPPPSAPAAPTTAAPADTPATPPADPTKPIIPETVADPDVPRQDRRIPRERHEQILTGLREEHEKTIQTLKTDYEQQLGAARTQLQLLDIADKDPDRFLDALAQADPRYAERLAFRRTNGNGHAPASPQPEPGAEMPLPDGTLGDGTGGYTMDGIRALLDWQAAQVRRDIEQKLEQRYGPVLQKHEADAALQAATTRVAAKLQDAIQNWDGFAEAQGDIAKALRADPRLDLFGAYRQVVFPKLKADRDRIRSEVLAEIQGKPLKVSATTPAGSPPPSAVSGDLQSVIRDAIRGLPRE